MTEVIGQIYLYIADVCVCVWELTHAYVYRGQERQVVYTN